MWDFFTTYDVRYYNKVKESDHSLKLRECVDALILLLKVNVIKGRSGRLFSFLQYGDLMSEM
jgi:hypothetical protein